jgi:hypothetical protein
VYIGANAGLDCSNSKEAAPIFFGYGNFFRKKQLKFQLVFLATEM